MRRLQSALSEVLAAKGTMGQFNALTQPCKEYGMFAHNIATPHRVHSNFVLCPLTQVTFASVANTPFILKLTPACDNLSQPPGCTTWCILLPTMVKLQNLDVKARAQHPVRFRGQPEQKINADTEIRGDQDRSPRGGSSQFLKLIIGMSSRSSAGGLAVGWEEGGDRHSPLGLWNTNTPVTGCNRRG